MSSSGGLDLLVAATDQSFAATATDYLTATAAVRDVTTVGSVDKATTRVEEKPVDGVLVDNRIAAPADVIDRLTRTETLPVVFLADSERTQSDVEAALNAGAIDVFPRVTAEPQYELIVERIQQAQQSQTEPETGDTAGLHADSGPLREVFENVSDGLVVHDSETGEIL